MPDPATLAMVRFDTEAIERFRPMIDLQKVEPLTGSDFQPRGGTPLLDAVGQTITALDADWKKEQPERCIMVIVTDGEENSSREYTKGKIKELIQSRQDSGKWAFIYLGANVDSFAEAGSMGISVFNTANYHNTVAGTQSMYSASSATVKHMRATGATLATNLGGTIEEDGTVVKSVPANSIPQKVEAWQAPVTQQTWVPPI